MNSPVLRNILAAIVGYVVMVALVFVTFSIVWMILGADGAFEAGSWDVTGTWIGASILFGFVAAKAGGFVCSKLAASHQAVLILIGIVVTLGIVAAIPDVTVAAGPRPDDVSMFDAMGSAEQPRWVAWLNPLIGALGVMLGARLGSRRGA